VTATAFMLVFGNIAFGFVGIEDNPANPMHYGVLSGMRQNPGRADLLFKPLFLTLVLLKFGQEQFELRHALLADLTVPS
jgi:hypothetical protein